MADDKPIPPAPEGNPDERKKQSQRNVAIALSLAVFIVLVFLVTIFRIGGSIADRTF